MQRQRPAVAGGNPPGHNRGPAPSESVGALSNVESGRGSNGETGNGETGTDMNAIVTGARSRSTVLTGAAGLLLLMTAVVMMVCAAPRIHVARHGSGVHEQLSSWVWVTGDHGLRVTPAPLGGLTGTHRPLVP